MRGFVDIHTHNFTGSNIELRAVGLHPWDAESVDFSTLNEALFSQAQAIGEIGLDYACKVDKAKQEELFCRQLEIAERLRKPVVLHCVKAFESVINLLLKYSLKAVVFHGFIGSRQQAEAAIGRGYYLSFGHRTVCSPKSIEALRVTPLSGLFVETDESGMAIEDIYKEIASLRGVSIEELSEAVYVNYNLIYNK